MRDKLSKTCRDIITLMHSGHVLKCWGPPEKAVDAWIGFSTFPSEARRIKPQTLTRLIELDLVYLGTSPADEYYPTIMRLTPKGEELAKEQD